MDRENNHTESKNFRIKNYLCILLNILEGIYLLESFTWIPIQIFIFTAILNYAMWNCMY